MGARLLHAVAAAARDIGGVGDLRHDVFIADLAGMLKHRTAVDLEAFAELNVGAHDKFLQRGLARGKRQLPQVVDVEVEQVEGDQVDLGAALEFVFAPLLLSKRGRRPHPERPPHSFSPLG